MATKGNWIKAAVISVSVEALPFGNITIAQQPSSPLLLGLLSYLNQKPRLVSKDGRSNICVSGSTAIGSLHYCSALKPLLSGWLLSLSETQIGE